MEGRGKAVVAHDPGVRPCRGDAKAGRVKPADRVLGRLDAKYRKRAKAPA